MMGRAVLLRRRVWWPRSKEALPSGEGDDYRREMGLLVEPEVGQVVVLHDVWLRLQPHFVGALGLRFAARLNEIRKADDFRADEALLDVRVNGAAGFPGRQALPNRPGAVFLAANGPEMGRAHV